MRGAACFWGQDLRPLLVMSMAVINLEVENCRALNGAASSASQALPGASARTEAWAAGALTPEPAGRPSGGAGEAAVRRLPRSSAEGEGRRDLALQWEELRGHEAPVVAAAFSPGGQNVATADRAGVVRIWAPESLAADESRAAVLLTAHPSPASPGMCALTKSCEPCLAHQQDPRQAPYLTPLGCVSYLPLLGRTSKLALDSNSGHGLLCLPV